MEATTFPIPTISAIFVLQRFETAMLFSSAIFLFLFLPLVLTVYFLSPKRFRNAVLLLASLAFYTWGEQVMVLLILLSAVVDYTAGILIKKRFRKQGLFLSVVFNLGILIYFKYANFLFENLFFVSDSLGFEAQSFAAFSEVALPLGISFYTFQTMSYTFDVYRGKVEASTNFLNFVTYVTLFPQLVAGPIVRYDEVAKELTQRDTTVSDFSEGIRRFVIGFGKKMLLANNLAYVADGAFDLPASQLSTSFAWVGLLAYSLQIYFDFSGYSDMAIGLGRMFGFRFPENFNYPYFSKSIREFWRRWHITLSAWFKDYLYISMGGNRVPPWRVYLNLLVVFFATGLWHGAKWTFVVWGLWHGIFLIAERVFKKQKSLKRLPHVFYHIYALFVVGVGWVFFRAPNLESALQYLKRLFSFATESSDNSFLAYFLRTESLIAFIFAGFLAFPFQEFLKTRGKSFLEKRATLFLISERLFLLLVFAFSCFYIAVDAYNPFIYFRF